MPLAVPAKLEESDITVTIADGHTLSLGGYIVEVFRRGQAEPDPPTVPPPLAIVTTVVDAGTWR